MALACEHDGDRGACRSVPGCDERIGLQIASAASEPPLHHDDHPARHLTPAVGRSVRDAAAQALEPVLRGGFTVTHVDVRGDTIEVAIRGADDRQYGVTLALPESKREGRPDGRGRNFLFYLAPAASGSNSVASELLLAAAARLDAAIPDTVLPTE